MSIETDVPCYTARCLCGCGGLVFAAVDDATDDKKRKRETAKEVAWMIRKGYVIERMTVGEVRAAKFTCQKRKAASI